jgi:threonine dehydrogenase-like Zn-dependent dehydrogenase
MIANKQILLDKIVTHTLPLSEFQKGMDMVVKGEESIKVVLLP